MSLDQKFHSTTQAAELLGYTSAHVRRLILDKNLIAQKVGTDWLISEKEIKRFLAAKGKKKKKDKTHDKHSRETE